MAITDIHPRQIEVCTLPDGWRALTILDNGREIFHARLDPSSAAHLAALLGASVWAEARVMGNALSVPADHLLSPDQIAAAAKSNGIGLTELCKRAQISTSTFTRWRAGKTEPTLDVYRRLVSAARSAEVESTAPVQAVAAPRQKVA